MIHKSISLKAINPQNYYTLAITYNNMGPVEVKQSIAISTSLPEVVVSTAAVKMGAINLAVGNLFGSNIFNLLILGIDDLFFVKGPLLSFVNQNHAISGLSAIAMTSVAIIGLTYRAEKKKLLLAWDSAGTVSIFVINLMLLYLLK
jgi:cation:H+ antiporter